MDNGSWFIVHGNLLFMGYLFLWIRYVIVIKTLLVIPNAVKDLLFAMLLRPVQFANRSFIPTYDLFVKNFFVILNAVKDLLFAMLLRPVKSANRSFTAFRMTNLLKRHFTFRGHRIFKLRMTNLLKHCFFLRFKALLLFHHRFCQHSLFNKFNRGAAIAQEFLVKILQLIFITHFIFPGIAQVHDLFKTGVVTG